MSRASRAERQWKILKDRLGVFYTHPRPEVLWRFARLVARQHPENDYTLSNGLIYYRKRRGTV